jgi:hypothetical protein
MKNNIDTFKTKFRGGLVLICQKCNKVYKHGEWINVRRRDLENMGLDCCEVKHTMCSHCKQDMRPS